MPIMETNEWIAIYVDLCYEPVFNEEIFQSRPTSSFE